MDQNNCFKQTINALIIQNNLSTDELREQIFFRRDLTVIIPDKEKCNLYGLKYGDRLISNDGKLSVIAVGVEDSKLWFQFEKHSDNARLSYWPDFNSYSDLHVIGYRDTHENVTPQYITHYELYFILHTMHLYNYFNEFKIAKYIFPISFNLFLPFEILLSNDISISGTKSCFLSHLPLDLITDIFEFCSPIDTFNASFVCKSWYKKIRQSRIWEKYCKLYKIKYNQDILEHDYNGDKVKYYFYRGIARKLDFSIKGSEDINALCSRKYYLGGLYWSFVAHKNNIYLRMHPLTQLSMDLNLKISIYIKINTLSETKEVVSAYDCMRCIEILSFDILVPLKCTVTVELHRSLISLMQSTAV